MFVRLLSFTVTSLPSFYTIPNHRVWNWLTWYLLSVHCRFKDHFLCRCPVFPDRDTVSWFWLTVNNVGKPCSWSRGAPATKRTSTVNMDIQWRNTYHYGNGKEIVWDWIPPCLAIAVPQKVFLQPAGTIRRRCCFLDLSMMICHLRFIPSIDQVAMAGLLLVSKSPPNMIKPAWTRWRSMRQVWCLSQKQYWIHTSSVVSATEQNPSPPLHHFC